MGDGGEEGQIQLARKVRGPTTLKFLDALLPGQKFQVESWLNSPVGPNSNYMSMFISHLAKDGNNLPLTVPWTQMPAESILNAILEVKKFFDYPDDLNDWIIAKLHDRWNSHKHDVKKEGFYKYNTLEERLANRPNDVVESQWEPLIEYWLNPLHEARSAKSKASNAKRKDKHRGGSKPHVKYAAELEAKLKRPPTAQEIYDATHSTRKSPYYSSKKIEMNAEASASREITAVSRNKHENLVQECVTEDDEDNTQADSDEQPPHCLIFEHFRMVNGGEEGQLLARKVRGPSTLKFLDTLQPGQKLKVESWLNAAVGPNSAYLTTFISHLAKDGNKLPLTIAKWNQMPSVFVLNAVLEVKKVFDCPDDLDDWIVAKLHDRWKSHKHLVKKEGFYKHTTQEERLAHRPKDVVESQWGLLIEYWQDPRTEKILLK